jgi:hypothetical protein
MNRVLNYDTNKVLHEAWIRLAFTHNSRIIIKGLGTSLQVTPALIITLFTGTPRIVYFSGESNLKRI